MRRSISILILGAAGLTAFAAPALAAPPDSSVPPETTVADDSAPLETEPVGTGATAELSPANGPIAIVLDESGSENAAISVAKVEPAWTEFGEGSEPASGYEYLRLTVVIESRSPRGLFDVDYNDFILQDADGFVTGAEVVPTAEQVAAEEEPIVEASLTNAQTVELAITFETVTGVAPRAVFYAPDAERLLTVLDMG